MSLGIVARADQSGLAQLSEQVIDRLQPERVLVVSLGHLNRGAHDPHRYDAPGRRVFHTQHPGGFDSATLSGFLGGLTHAFTAETWYDRVLPDACVQWGVKRHIYIMPELYNARRAELAADHVWLPCGLGPNDGRRMPGVGILPWWSPTDAPTVPRIVAAHQKSIASEGLVTFVHPTGQAMADRNGTASVLAAAAHMRAVARIVIVGNQQHFGERCTVGNVTIERVPRVEHWSEVYSLGDVLVLPRRYGWLSLPMFEAPAFGMPVVTTDVWPQREWFADMGQCLVKTVGAPAAIPMKGGSTLVWTADPRELAYAMDFLTRRDVLQEASVLFAAWAKTHDWSTVERQWKEAFA